MLVRSVLICLMGVCAAMVPGLAEIGSDDEPVLRLRFSDPVLDAAVKPVLRPRFSESLTTPRRVLPRAKVHVADAGRVGSFAYVSTPVPNLVLVAGATEDASEIGRKIDRVVSSSDAANAFFTSERDTMPFIGLGLHAGSPRRGWSADASLGACLTGTPDATRLSDRVLANHRNQFEPETRANIRVRYRF